MNVIIWRNAVLLLPQLQPLTVVIGCIVLSFPTNWLKNFSLLSFLSVFGLMCARASNSQPHRESNSQCQPARPSGAPS